MQAAFGFADNDVGDAADVAGGVVQRIIDTAAGEFDSRPTGGADQQRRDAEAG